MIPGDWKTEREELKMCIRLMNASNRVIKNWGIDSYDVFMTNRLNEHMSFDTFLKHCYATGGDWGQMLLTGVRELFPEEVYNAIPDNMGLHAFFTIVHMLEIMNVY